MPHNIKIVQYLATKLLHALQKRQRVINASTSHLNRPEYFRKMRGFHHKAAHFGAAACYPNNRFAAIYRA
jgi:hypothetical protein